MDYINLQEKSQFFMFNNIIYVLDFTKGYCNYFDAQNKCIMVIFTIFIIINFLMSLHIT